MGSENHEKNKFNNFIVQGGILALAGILVRILGLAKRIPLAYIIGDVGNAYYSAAFDVYNIAISVSAYGLPLAVSKLVSARVSKGEYKNADRVFKCALKFASTIGLLAAAFVFIFSDFLSRSLSEPMSYLALRVLAPALFFVCIMAVFRGYFQGMGNMVPTAMSQLVEQIFYVCIGIAAAYFLSGYGEKVGLILHNENYREAYGAAGATLGCLAGAIAGLAFIIFIYKYNEKTLKKRIYRDPTDVYESKLSIYRNLILTVIPVIVSSFVTNVSNYLDHYFFNTITISRGLEATTNWGIYSGKYLVLINVPIALAYAMGASAVPTISGGMKKKNYEDVKHKIESVIRITMMIAFPCAIGLFALAPSLMYFLFSTTGSVAPTIVRFGALGVVLFSFSTLTNGILQGMSHMSKPITHGLIALVLHMCILNCLLRFTNLNINAVALSNNFFALFMCALNLYSIIKLLGYRQEIKRTFVMPFVAASLMGIVVFFLDRVFSSSGYSRILIIVNICIGAVVYAAFLVFTKAITREELIKFPGGTRLYTILNRLNLMN